MFLKMPDAFASKKNDTKKNNHEKDKSYFNDSTYAAFSTTYVCTNANAARSSYLGCE